MRYHININYEKDSTIKDSQDPRKRLEKFVITNLGRINRDQIRELVPDLSAHDETDGVTEFVQSNNPYTILQNCFYRNDLKIIAKQLDNTIDITMNTDDIVGKMLYALGFKEKMEPTGLYQFLEKLDQSQDNVKQMAEDMDKLLRKLFLFYSYTLRQYALAEFNAAVTSEEVNGVDAVEVPDADNVAEGKDTIITPDEIADPIGTIEKLLQNYRKKTSKSLGDLYQWLKKLMRLVEESRELTDYCQRHFQREIPLNSNQIAEIGMFRTYRNLIGSGHLMDNDSWERHKKRTETDLDDMDNATREEWKRNWDYVIRQCESEEPLPEPEMFQRMRAFFRKFLNLLSENQIYPKVIVMREYKVDEYGTVEVFADSSDPNESVILTNCEFKPFTEFYYHSRTNPTGIEPILITKEELEGWGTRQDNNTEN